MPKHELDGLTALEVISAEGAPATITRRTSTLTDPVTQTVTSVDTEFTVQAVALPPSRSALLRVNTSEHLNLMEFHLALQGTGYEPMPGDIIAWGGFDWNVMFASILNPSGDGAVYASALAQR